MHDDPILSKTTFANIQPLKPKCGMFSLKNKRKEEPHLPIKFLLSSSLLISFFFLYKILHTFVTIFQIFFSHGIVVISSHLKL